MTGCLFRRSDGVFVSGKRLGEIPHDPATHVQIDLPKNPDRRTERWDGASGIRAATVQEIADFDVAEAAAIPLDAEELYDMLVTKGVVMDSDRPRSRP